MTAGPDDEALEEPVGDELEEQLDERLFEELRGVARRASGPPSIPGYRVEGELFRGGQGIVYRAVQESTQRVVALKVMAERNAFSARERRRFEREVELGSRLAHPGIVTVFDSGVAGGAPWYAMELVVGERLDAFVARASPPLAERLRLFLELCAAVAHAHRSGVIHRDLKPANVLVDAGGRVRVLDFGTALPVDARRLTEPGEFLGTLAYASPEQVGGGSEACDTRTDVYSLGVVLYELVTGRLPIDVDAGLAEVVRRIEREPPRPPGPLERDLGVILARGLEKERERRYPSVEALARDVRHFQRHEPIEARAHSTGYVLRLALRRHRRSVGAAALALALGTLLAGAFARERWNARRAGEQAQLVRGVFEDILAAAAPQRMGGDAPLRDVLALAAREIETALEDAPDAQAAVQLTIGDTYRRLLMSAAAEGHLRAALARFRAADAGGLETARCLDVLGQVLSAQGSSEAIAVQEEALAIRRRRLGDADPLVAESERALAVALVSQVRDGDTARAGTLLASALERFRAALGDEHVEVAETQLTLARLERRGDSAARGALLDQALAVFERPENARDPRRIACLNEYSQHLQDQDRFDEAEAFLARAQGLTRELYGEELATEMLRRQADLRYARGEMAGAEELTRRALVFELRLWAERRPDDGPAIERVAAALEAARPPASEPPYVEAFQLLRRFQGDGAFELAGWMNGIVVTLLPQGRASASEALLREALHIRCRAWGSDCPIRQRTLELLAEALRAQERAAEARTPLEESIAIAERRGEPESARDARELLALCCAEGSVEQP
jgi:tetratricopeptide (TPR) repeat protein